MAGHKLYCPYCGGVMEQHDAGLHCAPCAISLPARLSREMAEFYAAGLAEHGKQLAFKDNNTWYCPGCGGAIQSEPGFVTCSTCGQSLNQFVFRLRKAREKKG